MQTVAETNAYATKAEKHLTLKERDQVIEMLASNPKAGDVMEGTGGIRKIRFAKGNKGKSGGVRVIYYYHSEDIPVLLLTLFAKNEQGNLTKAERNSLAQVVKAIKQSLA